MGTPERHISLEGPNAFAATREFLAPDARLDLAFAATGMAPAASFVVVDEHVTRRIAGEIGTLGLTTRIVPDLHLGNLDYALVVCAWEPDNADALAAIQEQTSEYHERYGRLSGIPQTAIRAYAADIALTEAQLPQDIVDHPYYAVSLFLLSPDHYREEWEQFVGNVHRIGREFPTLAAKLDLTAIINAGSAYAPKMEAK